MSSPATPLEVIQRLGELTGQLDRTVDELVKAELDMARKRHAADIAEAKAFLNAVGSIPSRERDALLETKAEEDAALVAEATVRGLKARIKALEIRIDVGR